MISTTLADECGTVHAVTLPDIPADTPDTASVTPRAACGAGHAQSLPASLARLTTGPRFRLRPVTCAACLS